MHIRKEMRSSRGLHMAQADKLALAAAISHTSSKYYSMIPSACIEAGHKNSGEPEQSLAPLRQFTYGQEPWFTTALKKRVKCIEFARKKPHCRMSRFSFAKSTFPIPKEVHVAQSWPHLPVTLSSHLASATSNIRSSRNNSTPMIEKRKFYNFSITGTTAHMATAAPKSS